MTGSISVSGRTTTSLTITGSWSSSYNVMINKITIHCERYSDGAGNTSQSFSFNTTSSKSASATFTGLAQNTRYKVYARFYANTGAIRETAINDNVATLSQGGGGGDPSPSKPGNISNVSIVPSTQTIGKIYLSWSSATNATNYRYEIYTVNHTNVVSGGTPYTSAEITGLSQHTQYYAKVYAQNGSGNGSPNDGNYFVTHDFRPPKPGDISTVSAIPSSTTAGRVSVAWTASSYAEGYKIEIWTASGSLASPQVNVGSSVRETAFSGLAQYTQYYAKVYGYNSSGNGNGKLSSTIRTADLTAPSISNVSGDGKGRAYISFSASDSGSGIRSSNPYYVEISSADGSTYGNGGWVSTTYRTFTEDASGKALKQNSWYYMRVTAYDNSNNSSTSSVRVQYKMTRPDNWTWHTEKIKGQDVNLTAAEWNSFCTRINQFRIYGMSTPSNYTFTTAVKGTEITASIANEARTAISQIGVAVPSAATKSGEMTASFFNGLRDSLKSIT